MSPHKSTFPPTAYAVHRSLDEALAATIRDKEYVLVRHSLRAGRRVAEHFHPKASETLIVPDGGFLLYTDLTLSHVDETRGYVAITFPPHTLHGLEAEQNMNYFVLRTKQDETVWLSDLEQDALKQNPPEGRGELIWELYNKGNLSLAYVQVTGSVRSHFHKTTHEIYRVERGHGNVVVKGKPAVLNTGDVLQIPPGTRHFLKKTRGIFEVLCLSHPGYDQRDVFY